MAKPPEPVRPAGPLRIALLAPLSGDFADAGRELANGAAMAMYDTPSASAEIAAFDTGADETSAAAALQAAADIQADIVVGPLFGRNAIALRDDLSLKGLTAISFSTDSSAVSPNVVIAGRSPAAETTRIVRHAFGSGSAVIGVFGKQDRFGAAVANQAQQEAFARPGGLFVRPMLFSPGADYNEINERARAAVSGAGGRPDALLMTLSGVDLIAAAAMLQSHDIDKAGIRLFGLSGWDALDPSRARELTGGRFAAEPYRPIFDDRYAAAFGGDPSELAGVAYDAVKVALAAHKVTAARPIPPDALAAAGDVSGAHGLVRISGTGIALRPLEILEMQPGGVRPVEPARIEDPATLPTPPIGSGS